MNIYNNFVHRHVKTLGSRLDNTDIRLMRNEEIKILPAHSCALQGGLYRLPHDLGCKAEHRLAVHMDEVKPLLDRLRGNRTKAAARWDIERIAARAVAAEVKGTHAIAFLDRSKQGRSRTITEENTGIAILPVNDFRQYFAADDKNMAINAALNELRCN